MDDAITYMTKMLIDEHIKGDKITLKMTKEELLIFCIKLLKTIEQNI